MKMLTTTWARIIFALPFAIFGISHFMYPDMISQMVPVPPVYFWTYFIGACLIAASLAIITKRLGAIASFLLAALLLTFIVTIHIPGMMNEETMMASMTSLLKDLGLMGGALAFGGIFWREQMAKTAGVEERRAKEEEEKKAPKEEREKVSADGKEPVSV